MTLRFLAPCLLLLAACQQLPTTSTSEVPMLAPVTAQSETSLQLGQVMEIALEANPGTGYKWKLIENGQPQLLEIELPASAQTATEPPRLGAAQTMRLHLRAVRAGTCTVLLEYRRPWETDAPPAATARYRVNVR